MPSDLEQRVQALENQVQIINETLLKLDFFNVNESNNSLIFSQVDYEKLTDEQKNNGKIYLIKD
ncbi:hypothetical protein GHK77_08695 [Campylobacter jejuni]|nr:hypothetical protein [Campylobacter jejuni]EHT2883434.1 hypothetical protein [Campylobacter coli]EDP2938677.1 hypothetical protein [Campylobacter jejuni]EFB5611674.1 hypothetical protein [Campylobacter jejuni]EGC6704070.1 hypothetical protein [Campylobacter jejuni]